MPVLKKWTVMEPTFCKTGQSDFFTDTRATLWQHNVSYWWRGTFNCGVPFDKTLARASPEQRRGVGALILFPFTEQLFSGPDKKKQNNCNCLRACSSFPVLVTTKPPLSSLRVVIGPVNSDGRVPRYVSGRLQTQISADPSASQGYHDMTDGCFSLPPIMARRTQ